MGDFTIIISNFLGRGILKIFLWGIVILIWALVALVIREIFK